MENISNTNTTKSMSNPAMRSIGRSNSTLFSKELKLSKAETLLRSTSQFENWIKLCQRDDELAVKTADIILKRHHFLQQAKSGQSIDWSVFDNLTQQLRENNISLFDSSDLFQRNRTLAKSGEKAKEDSKNQFPENLAKPENLKELTAPSVSTQAVQQTQTIDTPTKKADKTAETVDETQETLAKNADFYEKIPFSISDENFLLINVVYKKHLLGSNLSGYGDSDKLLLSLDEILTALDFSIETDGEKGTANGWFITEEKTFSLDTGKNEVTVDGKTTKIPPDSVELVEGELYVDTNLLSQWFPVDFNYKFSDQSVSIQPWEKLPFQARLERTNNLGQINSVEGRGTVFPREYSEYKLFSFPIIDLNLKNSYSTDSNAKNNFNPNLSIHSVGDFGKMTAELYTTVNKSEQFDDTKFTLKRFDPDANLLGPLKATKVLLGDIKTTHGGFSGTGEDERGFRITNETINRPSNFDTTFFEGPLPPGWDVELYRNNTLLRTYRVRADGRYQFNDVALNYGKNDFKLLFYGPQGQERTETKTINIGTDFLKPGQGQYDLSLTQKNSSLYDPYETIETVDEGSLRLNAQYEHGINKNLSLTAGISSQEINSERHTFLNPGFTASYKDILFRGNLIHDIKGGNGLEATAKTNIGKTNLTVQQKYYDDLLDNSYYQTNISAGRVFKGNSILPDISTSAYYQGTERDRSRDHQLGLNLSTQIKDLYLNNVLHWEQTSTKSEKASSLEGEFKARAKLGNFSTYGYLEYKLDPNAELTKAGISNLYRFNNEITGHLDLTKDFESDDSYTATMGVDWSWDNGKYTISPGISYNSDNEATAMLNFSTSFGKKPRTNKIYASSKNIADEGALSVKVYHDKNLNAVFDEGDEIIEGASIKAKQAHRQAKTDKDGVVLISMPQAYQPTDIILEKDSLDDPFLEPLTPGRSIVPRPGHIQTMEIPVAITGEIDGTLSIETDHGWEKPLSNVKVQLVNEAGEIVQEVRSEHDGFYYFQKVFPGKYTVIIDPDNKRSEGMTKTPIEIEIGDEGDIVSGMDYFLKKENKMVTDAKTPSEFGMPPKTETSRKVDLAEKVSKATEIAESQQIPARSEVHESPSQTSLAPKHDKIDIPPIRDMGEMNKNKSQKIEPDDLIAADSQIQISNTTPLKAETDGGSPGLPKYGLHLTSYRTAEKATAGINFLMKKYKGILDNFDFTIKKVNVSEEKGVWYRVIVGSDLNKKGIEKIQETIKMSAPYCKVVNFSKDADKYNGVHLTSFRTREKALLSIKELRVQYPSLLKNTPFTIQNVDLGPKLGKWKRVVAGKFSEESNAEKLLKRIKSHSPYSKIMPVEKTNAPVIHLASYRTNTKAVEGLKLLQKEFGSMMNNENFSIRKVDLGEEKGIWHRILIGGFKGKNSAVSIKNSLNQQKQYARIMKL